MEIIFGRMTAGDLVTMHQWLNEAGIVRWWDDDDGPCELYALDR